MLRVRVIQAGLLAGLFAALCLLNPTSEARALRSQPDDSPSPSDRRAPLQNGAIQKSHVQSPVQSPLQKSACEPRCGKIAYRHHCSVRKTCCCGCDTIERTLMVADPSCCGRTICVPVCLPACCTDCPKENEHGILCRGVTTFRWCCGYKVKVVVDRCGDVTVHSYGR